MDLCCRLYRALTLEPVPVIGDMLYAVGAVGVNLRELSLPTDSRCAMHKYNLETAIDALLKEGKKGKRCVRRRRGDGASTEDSTAAKRSRACSWNTSTLWAYELEPVVNAYRWLWQNRSSLYSQCCDAVVVCQMKRSESLPPGLYVYMTCPRPSCCHYTAERPLAVIDQFHGSAPGTHTNVPAIYMYPGKDSFSAMYVVRRRLVGVNNDCKTVKYGNRMYGEALALRLINPFAGDELCTSHNVALRNDHMYVMDLRWNSFNTRSECVKAIPRSKGLRGLFWANHTCDPQEIERQVLFWLFGFNNELPREVNTLENENEKHSVTYLLLDLTRFQEDLPQPPSKDESWFLHVYFEGDFDIATYAIGIVPDGMSRISTPVAAHKEIYWHQLELCHGKRPTPYSVGTAYESAVCEQDTKLLLNIQKYAFAKTGGCMGVAVNYTLCYDWASEEYKVMVCHTIMDSNDCLDFFKL